MERRLLEELEDRLKEEKDALQTGANGLEASMSEEKEGVVSNFAINAVKKPFLRDLPFVLISAWQPNRLSSPQTVTFESFLANYNNGERPGGGDGVLDLDSGIFTCITPGYYTVSFSAYGAVGPSYINPTLHLFKNGVLLPESVWYIVQSGALNAAVGVISSRILILHMDA